MTRLTQNDLLGLEHLLETYDKELIGKTGQTLRQIACSAAGITEDKITRTASDYNICVVPITSGEGIIPSFVQFVKSIITHLGCRARVTYMTDVSGIAEAIDSGANMIFMADDHRFIVLNTKVNAVIDNAEATAQGYVAALNAMSKGLDGRHVLVIGAGRVGKFAITNLRELGANVAVYETDSEKLQYIRRAGIEVVENLINTLPKFRYIVDASTEAGFIDLEYLNPSAVIVAPGIPLGLTERAYEVYSNRVIHDPLQLGVATMLAMAICCHLG